MIARRVRNSTQAERQHKRKAAEGHMASTREGGEDNKQFLQSSDDLRRQLSSAINTHQSAEIAVLHIMKQFDFYPSQLEQILSG
jgi:hypothetical protein